MWYILPFAWTFDNVHNHYAKSMQQLSVYFLGSKKKLGFALENKLKSTTTSLHLRTVRLIYYLFDELNSHNVYLQVQVKHIRMLLCKQKNKKKGNIDFFFLIFFLSQMYVFQYFTALHSSL